MLSACSGEAAQIAVTLTPGFSGAFTPGATNASFTVTVQNPASYRQISAGVTGPGTVKALSGMGGVGTRIASR